MISRGGVRGSIERGGDYYIITLLVEGGGGGGGGGRASQSFYGNCELKGTDSYSYYIFNLQGVSLNFSKKMHYIVS